ncbi:MAG: sulfur carrier protein ThiS [Burkholderiaceae bacterium]
MMRLATQTLSVVVNGAPQTLDAGATVADLLVRMDAAGKRVAVERNGEIVPKSRHGDTRLADGDRLEVVIAVGGG